jgi:hypothetical protein
MRLQNHKSFLFYTLLISCIFLLSQVFKISTLELTTLKSTEKFGDLRLVFDWAGCYKEISSAVYQTYNPTISCSGYIYGGLLLPLILLLGISSSMTNIFGYFFCILVAVIFAYVGYFGKKKSVFMVLLIISPPIALIIDRANFDVLIAFLVLISAILFSRAHETSSIILIGITVLIKFYTLPLLILSVLLSRTIRSKIIGSAIVLATGLLTVIDLGKVATGFPNGYFAKFGFSIWSLYAEKIPLLKSQSTIAQTLNSLVGIFIILLLLILVRKAPGLNWNFKSLSPTQTLTIWNLTAHLSCFIAGMSYDYRLLFIVTASVSYLSEAQLTNRSFEKYAITTLLLVSCWFTFLIPEIAPIGDLTLEILTFWLVFRISAPMISSMRSRSA